MNECLIYYKFSTLENKERIKSILSDLKKDIILKKISSVFKRKNLKSNSIEEIQEFVIRAQTESDAFDIIRRMNLKEVKTSLKYQMELLVFNDEVKMTPNLTLPHPSLYLDPLILHCSAEVWPEYVHPVSKIPLRKADIETNVSLFEFLYQGKIYLDT